MKFWRLIIKAGHFIEQNQAIDTTVGTFFWKRQSVGLASTSVIALVLEGKLVAGAAIAEAASKILRYAVNIYDQCPNKCKPPCAY